MHPLSLPARLLGNIWSMPSIWAAIWIASFVNAAIGISLVPAYDAGGFCFFPSTPPHFYGNLVIFIPRTLCFITVIAIYLRLFLFFRRKSSSQAIATQSSPFPSISMNGHLSTPVSFVDLAIRDRPDANKTDQIDPNSYFDSHQMEERPLPYSRHSMASLASSHTKLALYQTKWLRKGSKDSQMTLVNPTHLRFVNKPTLSPNRAAPENPIQESAEESASVQAAGSPVFSKNSKAISEGSDGLSRQISQINALGALPVSREPTMPISSSSSSLHPRSSQESICNITQHDTATYRFPPHTTPSEPSPLTDTIPPLSRIVVLPPPPPIRIKPPRAYSGISSRSDYTVSNEIQNRSADTVEQQSPKPSHLSNGKEEVPEADEAETQADEGEDLIMGVWEALVDIPRDHSEGRVHDNCDNIPVPRRMSAAEESRRVSYLMMLYPIAVSPAFSHSF